MNGTWFGDLYFESTADLLTPRLSALEAEVISSLLRLRAGERVLDVACGHGRHLEALGGRGLRLVGIDLDRGYLRLAATATDDPRTARPERGRRSLVRADQRQLPFGPAFDAAFSWYSSLFLENDDGNERTLAEVGRVLAPRGRLLVQHANPLRLAGEPEVRAARDLPGGGRVEESSRFDPATGVETLSRVITRGDRVLAGTARLRYYRPTEWERIAARAGLRLRDVVSTGPGAPGPLSERSLDLIAVLEKPT